MKELLPVKYDHAVFTLPHQLNSLVLGNSTAMFKLLFDAASYTLLKFAADKKYLGAQPGIIAVLHTWGQQLTFHPHIHCIVSGGGIDNNKRWKETLKAKHKFLFSGKSGSSSVSGLLSQTVATAHRQRHSNHDRSTAGWLACPSQFLIQHRVDHLF